LRTAEPTIIGAVLHISFLKGPADLGGSPRAYRAWPSVGAGDGNRTRTISLGTGLSCFADHSICSSEIICLVRECPLQTVSDRAIGHATGTMSADGWLDGDPLDANYRQRGR